MARNPVKVPAKTLETIRRWIGKVVGSIVLLVSVFSSPAAAVHDNLPCPPPPSFEPLFLFLHDVVHLAQLGGILLGFVGISAGGLLIAAPLGPDYARLGRKIIKSTIVGVLILLSAPLIIGFIINRFPIC